MDTSSWKCTRWEWQKLGKVVVDIAWSWGQRDRGRLVTVASSEEVVDG